jgi:hypothetical protein
VTVVATQAPGVVLQVPDDLGLPGGEDTLALAPVGRDVFDRIAHDHPAGADRPGSLVDVEAMGPALLSAAAVDPLLSEQDARTVLDEWPAGEVDALLEEVFALVPSDPVDRAWWRLERDTALRLEMDYCAPLALPHSVFLGSTSTVWTGHDRELALAWELRRRATCPGCGTRPDEWERDREAYIPDVRGPDKGCEVKQMTESQLSDEDRKAGVHVILEPRELVEARERAEQNDSESVDA